MKRLVAAIVVAFAVTVLVVPDAIALVRTGHAPRCSYATGVGDFCVSWNPALGQYDPPPPGVPADFSRATPDDGDTLFLATYAALVFVGTAVTTWLLLALFGAIRRRPRPEGSDPDDPGPADAAA